MKTERRCCDGGCGLTDHDFWFGFAAGLLCALWVLTLCWLLQ